MTVNILWVSRHTMTYEQEDDLKRIFGEISITQFDSTIADVSEIISYGVFDVYAVVLTAELIADLKKMVPENKMILQPVSERVYTEKNIKNPATGIEEKEYEYRHRCWRKVVKAEFETEEM